MEEAVGVRGPPVQLACVADEETVPDDGVAAHAGKLRRAAPTASAKARDVLRRRLMFILAVAQIGAGPVLIGAVIWMYATSESAWAPTALLVWSLFVGSIDNVLRPILIQRGGELPLIIVFAGVVGGLLTLGVIGIFLGPVVLAVVYTLVKAWVNDEAA